MLLDARPTAGQTLLASGRHHDVALVEHGAAISYGELRTRVTDRVAELQLGSRSLVVLSGDSSIEFVTTYLALLADGHVPLLAGDHVDRLVAAWRPAATVRSTDGGLDVRHCPGATHDLHPDLALLLTTSGSTGSPKLVRLSHDNVLSNATAIARSLRLTDQDRAITTLPLHYCYGLSVLHSHLVGGASVVMTMASVVDPCFMAAVRQGVTNLAGVPHTYELLERAGTDLGAAAGLRLLTQAGGRMGPERVRPWVERARGWGADFVVMYGQTEATARIAVLPPELAAEHPEAIGRPIPGGSLFLRPVEGQPDDVGELVYRGPNVMLGYATTAADLAFGPTLDELATGDLARYDPTSELFTIVGRRSRFVKPFGLRIDLDAVEADLARARIAATVAGDDGRLVIAAPSTPARRVVDHVAELTGLPDASITVLDGEPPRTAAGKVDLTALLASAPAATAGTRRADSVAAVFATVLGRSDVDAESTFVELGGDSLNYVECSVRLEELLGPLPADWHLLTVAQLGSRPRRSGRARVDTTVPLRALGIAAVVATHMSLWYFPGGAHLMLALVGYNVSRFHLSAPSSRQLLAAGARTVARVALPVIVFVGVAMLLVGGYSIPTVALVNNYAGPSSHQHGRWHYWFIEAIVQILVPLVLLLAIPAVRRVERRYPYLLPLGLFAVALTFRYHWLVIDGLGNLRFRTHGVVWFFLLGWLTQRSTTLATRLTTTALCLATIPGFFGRSEREWFIAVGIVLLVWWRELPMPRPLIRPLAGLAAASMWIYLTHFRIWPVLDRNVPALAAYALTLTAGVGVWWAVSRLTPLVPGARRRARSVAARRPATPRAFAATVS